MALNLQQSEVTAFRQFLRAATQDAHHRLDHHPLLAPLIRPGLQKTQYGYALQALFACQSAMQEGVAPLWQISTPPPFAASNRLSDLRHDLQYLGLAPWPLRGIRSFANAHTLHDQIGMLYVLEGAALGGKLIARCVRQQYANALPLTFFEGDAPDSQGRWFAYFEWAKSLCDPSHWSGVASAAVAVFESIIAHFDAQPLPTGFIDGVC